MSDAEKPKCRAFKVDGIRCQTDAIKAAEFKWCGSHKDEEKRKKGIAARKRLEEAKTAAEMDELLGSSAEIRNAARRSERWSAKRSGRLDEPAVALAKAEAVFRRWMGTGYDMGAFRVAVACAAVERMEGDPLWLLLVAGSGFAKTETVGPAVGAGAIVVSDISGPAALLSGTPEKEWGAEATGGLLRKLGRRGVLVIKDFTTILSMSRDKRAEVLGAFREIYDGKWSRELGSDGGVSLEWAGRVVVIGGVTTAWDASYAVIASMGDRFVLYRPESDGDALRRLVGMQALANVGSEPQMKAELAAAFGAVVESADIENPLQPTDTEVDRLLTVANLVTKARTGVEREYNGDVEFAHDAEAPTRFAKQLLQVLRGGVAIGMDRTAAMNLAIRCGRDSMPPIRLRIIDHLARWQLTDDGMVEEYQRTADIRRGVDRPWKTVDRALQTLHLLEVVDVVEFGPTGFTKLAEGESVDGQTGAVTNRRWAYRLAEGIDPEALLPL